MSFRDCRSNGVIAVSITMWLGERKLALRKTILIADNEEVRTNLTFGGKLLTLTIRFVADNGSKQRIDWDTRQPDTIKFTAYNWANALGSATPEPVLLGQMDDGRPFGFQLAHWRIGNLNRADFFLLVGGQNAKLDERKSDVP